MFRFTIRDVLWLTVVVAIVTASWLDRTAIQRQAADLERERELSSSLAEKEFMFRVEEKANSAQIYPLYYPPDANSL
jgi:hypothetical protein